ncbi:DUF7848 domain-containing protein [Streptomyces sp. NPDC054797]
MSRRILAHAEWTLSGDNSPGVPVAIFQMMCMNCHQMSEATDNDGTPHQTWALNHTGHSPEHREFKLVTETYWRVDPRRGNPYAELSA